MKQSFGLTPEGKSASLYTITGGGLSATVTDYGATWVSLLVPDRQGRTADVLLGFDAAAAYAASTCYIGAVVGRSANRIQGAAFRLNGEKVCLTPNENANNLHSGPDCFHLRMWEVESHTENAITLSLHSPHGDQGFPGNAHIRVTYRLDDEGGMHIIYDAVSDRDTVFNLTNHAYFNLAGQDHPEKAIDQLLTLPAAHFTPADAESIPTGEVRSVEGTPMDFRSPKAIGRDIDADYECLHLQGGYDHNWTVEADPCALLQDPESGRTMTVHTDCPGVQFYAGNFLTGDVGKGGIVYGKRSGICLETQYYPNSVNHPTWVKPITKAGENYHSETVYQFH